MALLSLSFKPKIAASVAPARPLPSLAFLLTPFRRAFGQRHVLVAGDILAQQQKVGLLPLALFPNLKLQIAAFIELTSDQLITLTAIYRRILERYFGQ